MWHIISEFVKVFKPLTRKIQTRNVVSFVSSCDEIKTKICTVKQSKITCYLSCDKVALWIGLVCIRKANANHVKFQQCWWALQSRMKKVKILKQFEFIKYTQILKNFLQAFILFGFLLTNVDSAEVTWFCYWVTSVVCLKCSGATKCESNQTGAYSRKF